MTISFEIVKKGKGKGKGKSKGNGKCKGNSKCKGKCGGPSLRSG
jgi:hypothetical protein